MAYVTKPALIPRDFGFIEPVEEPKKKPVEKEATQEQKPKEEVQTKKPKKPTVKKPTKKKKLARKLPWKV